jgi:hypothetical protein
MVSSHVIHTTSVHCNVLWQACNKGYETLEGSEYSALLQSGNICKKLCVGFCSWNSNAPVDTFVKI